MTLPSHIGQYRILRKIGAGGMGLVYLGEHTLLGRRAAVKTLLPTVAANREIVERFFNEARATSAIADPGVIQIYDFGYHVDGTAYIVMELLEGEALSTRLDRLGRIPLGDALRFARQVAGSLAAAHARDIVHRDLKPENIFLVRDAEAQGGERTKIIDFGICKMGAGDPNLTEVGVMIGTPVYMSPEQCRGSGEVDGRSDVYAFGCLVFHLLTGRPPFLGEASGDLIVAHLQEEPPPPSRYAPELPPAVDELVLTCLAKAPEDRYPSMTALAAALGDLVIAATTPVPAPVAPAPTVPLGRGFRSVYDASIGALGKSSLFGGPLAGGAGPGGSRAGSPVPDALRSRLGFASPPGWRPRPQLEIIDEDDDADAGEAEVAPPPRRAAVRAALACVLVVGVAAGLVITPLMAQDDSPPAANRPVTTALPIEAPADQAARPVMPSLVMPSTMPSVAHTEARAEHPREPDTASASNPSGVTQAVATSAAARHASGAPDTLTTPGKLDSVRPDAPDKLVSDKLAATDTVRAGEPDKLAATDTVRAGEPDKLGASDVADDDAPDASDTGDAPDKPDAPVIKRGAGKSASRARPGASSGSRASRAARAQIAPDPPSPRYVTTLGPITSPSASPPSGRTSSPAAPAAPSPSARPSSPPAQSPPAQSPPARSAAPAPAPRAAPSMPPSPPTEDLYDTR